MSAEQNKSIVRRLIEEVWNRGRVDLLRDLMSTDVRDENPLPGQPCGIDGQRWATETLRGAFSNMTLKVDDLIAEGDFVMDRWTGTAVHTGSFAGLTATGRKFTITGSDLMRFSGGKIVQYRHVEDNLGMLQQLGAAPPSQQPQSYGQRGMGTRNAGPHGGRELSDRDKKDFVRQGFGKLLDQGDLNSIAEFIHPDYVGHFSAFPPVYGHDGFREFLSIYTNGLSNRHTDIHDVLVEGDRVGCRVTYHGKNTGSMFGMPPTGRETEVDALVMLRLIGDKVAEQWSNNDDLRRMQQLGVIPVQAGQEAPQPC